jgi:hypothetical protein
VITLPGTYSAKKDRKQLEGKLYLKYDKGNFHPQGFSFLPRRWFVD